MQDEFGIARRARYEDFYRDFRWSIPQTFNFATDVVDRWARENDGLALIWQNEAGEEGSYRYSDIALESRRLAAVLRGQGLRKGDRVVVMLPRVPEWQIAIIACLRLGAVAIPCIEMLTERDVAYRVKNSGARGAICRAAQTAKFASVSDDIPVRLAIGHSAGWANWSDAMANARECDDAAIVGAGEPAMMYYTSGSTGEPKGLLHAARALYAWRISGIYWLDLSPGERIWCTADTGWSKAGTSILFGPWSCGACSFFYDGSFDPAERLRLLEKHRITVYCAPATELNRVVNEDVGRYDLSALRRTVSAGEATNPAIAEKWEKASGVRVDEAYGQTEVLMLVHNYPGEPVKYGSMGRPSPGSDVDIVDATGRRCGVGEEGQIAVTVPHPQLMLGYWRDEEKTANCFVQGDDATWFLTGDRGRKDEDGYIWYAGRNDDVINSAGYRIDPLEVENALIEHPAVLESAVVASPDADRGEIVKAYVVLKAGREPSDALARALQGHVKSITAPYKYPRAIEFIAELPKTATGKIRRSALRDRERPAGA